MDLQAVAFYMLAVVSVAGALGVIFARNPVHSVLFLILTFFSAAGLFVLLGAEFLAMLLVVVYVGAVAVLFLFVVMMLDVDFAQFRQGFARYLPFGGVIAALLLVEMIMVSSAVAANGAASAAGHAAPTVPLASLTNAEAIGQVLYTQYAYWFEAAGLVLLIAMIGAIVLTSHHRPHVRRQSVSKQVARTPQTGMHVVQIKSGDGVSE